MLLICPKNPLILIWTRNDEETLSLLGKLAAGTYHTLLGKPRTLGASSIVARVSAAHSHHNNTRHNDTTALPAVLFLLRQFGKTKTTCASWKLCTTTMR